MVLWLALAIGMQTQEPVPAVEGRGKPAVDVPRIEASIRVDGELTEDAWARAVRLTGFSQYEPVDGRPAEERTDVLVWYAADAIHFGILAFDSQPGSVRATNADRDNIGNDDHIIIYLDTFNDRRRAFFFAANPLGVQQDGVRSEGASAAGRMFGGESDTNPDFFWESRGRLTDDGYVIEIRIPFKSLRFAGSGPHEWGINVVRLVQRTGYTDTWTDVRRASNSFLVQSGTLTGLHDLDRGVVFEAQPFLTATANGARIPSSGRFDREQVDPDVGANVRIGLSNLSIDAAINPDFSQVETDEGQVTVNERFALFFNEKRPFFLENIDLFAAPSQLVYTRQIGNPLAGAKLTGKVGALGIAHLTAVDEVSAGDDALFNVTRVRRDFGTNSLAGIVFTDRSELGSSAFNRVLAGDVRVAFAQLYYFEAQAGASWTDDGDGVRRSPIWKAETDRTGRRFGFNWSISGIGRDFQARSGFVPRRDVVNAHALNRISFYGARAAAIETVTLFAGPSRIWTYGGFGGESAIEGGESLNVTTRFRGGWQLSARFERNFVRLDPADYAGYVVEAAGGPRPYQPLDRVAGPSAELQVTTPTFQRFGANASIERSREALFVEGSEGTGLSLSGELSLRPTESLRFLLLNTIQRLERRRDGSEFSRTIIPRLKAEYQPTRALFFRMVGEYRAERTAALQDARTGEPLSFPGRPVGPVRGSALRIDLLASYEPSPGTVAFLGYGSSMATEGTLVFNDLFRVADGFFLKLAYQFRR
jgi:hypothetical protein